MDTHTASRFRPGTPSITQIASQSGTPRTPARGALDAGLSHDIAFDLHPLGEGRGEEDEGRSQATEL